ncbi:MAG: hypothetical protein WC683_09560 [bacterium]
MSTTKGMPTDEELHRIFTAAREAAEWNVCTVAGYRAIWRAALEHAAATIGGLFLAEHLEPHEVVAICAEAIRAAKEG